MKKWYEMKAKGASTGEVLIYDEIGAYGISAKGFANDLKALGAVKVLDVHINSPGGSVIDGNAIYNSLKSHKARVNVYIDGVALSMGSVIAMAGDVVNMAENALFMIHNPFGMAFGDAEELRKTAGVMDKMKASLIKSYISKTGKTEDEISALMDAETWMDADEALEFGFIDAVTDAIEVAAHFDISKYEFENTPNGETNFDSSAKSTILPVHSDALANEATPLAAVNKTNEEEIMLTPEQIQAAAEKQAAEIKAASDKAVAQATEAEDNRKVEIASVFGKHAVAHVALLNTCIMDNTVTAESASKKLLTVLGDEAEQVVTNDHKIEIVADVRDKFVAGAMDSILARGGSQKDDTSNEFRGYTALDLAKKTLEMSNFSIKGMSKMQVVAAAFTHSTSDFPYLLENSLGKELRNAYGEFGETWSQWCDTGSVPDFKLNSRIQTGSFNNLDTIPEGGEYTAGSMGEDKATIQAATKGKMITMTRQMIINDDLSGFMRIARLMGRAAGRTVGSDVYTLLKANSLMFDGVAMFDAAHSNVAASAAAPTAAILGAMRTQMRKQKDIDDNEFLNIQPAYIICGVELEDTMNVLISSETDPSQANSKKPNPIRNIATLITDPRLNATEYYMVAKASEAPLIEVAFLDGNQTPYVESQMGFTVDGSMWKVRMDYGMSGIDFRGGVYNAGV